MNFKIPKNFRGIDGKKALERILNSKEETPIVQPIQNPIQQTGDLTFITDENLYKEISKYKVLFVKLGTHS